MGTILAVVGLSVIIAIVGLSVIFSVVIVVVVVGLSVVVAVDVFGATLSVVEPALNKYAILCLLKTQLIS